MRLSILALLRSSSAGSVGAWRAARFTLQKCDLGARATPHRHIEVICEPSAIPADSRQGTANDRAPTLGQCDRGFPRHHWYLAGNVLQRVHRQLDLWLCRGAAGRRRANGCDLHFRQRGCPAATHARPERRDDLASAGAVGISGAATAPDQPVWPQRAAGVRPALRRPPPALARAGGTTRADPLPGHTARPDLASDSSRAMWRDPLPGVRIPTL